MSSLIEDITTLENRIKKEIELFERVNKCSVANIEYKSYLYDSSRDSLMPTLAREVNVSIKRKVK